MTQVQELSTADVLAAHFTNIRSAARSAQPPVRPIDRPSGPRFRLAVALAAGFGVAVAAPGCGASARRFTEACAPAPSAGSSTDDVTPLALFVADPQIHHVYGRAVLSSSAIVDGTVSRTAIRPAVLNLLGPTVLRAAIQGAIERNRSDTAPTIVLGDMLNIACTGEWDRFESSVRASADDRVWLVAHGNHDSFFMGNYNIYVPARPENAEYRALPLARALDGVPFGCRDPADPTGALTWCPPSDYAFWSTDQSYFLAYSEHASTYGWPAVCASPDHSSAPMNKLAFLAAQLRALARQGAVVPAPESLRDGVEFEVAAAPESALGRANFGARGAVFWPGQRETNGDPGDLLRVGRGFLLQRIDLADDLQLILLDTAVYDPREGAIGSMRTAMAGLNGSLGSQQLCALGSYLRDARDAGNRVLLAGHFPLEVIWNATELLETIESSGAEVVGYVSAHTHVPFNERDQCFESTSLRQWNVGSTTDWPMELSTLVGAPGSNLFSWRHYTMTEPGEAYDGLTSTSLSTCPRIEYDASFRSAWDGIGQACSHEGAAAALLTQIATHDIPARWSEPPTQSCNGPESLTAALSLASTLAEIEALVQSDPQALEVAICLATGASREHGIMR